MKFSIAALEFERLKSLLSRFVSTKDARAAVADIAPSTDVAQLETEHALTAEAMAYLRVHRIPFRQIEFLAEVARENQLHLVCGVVGRCGGTLYCTVVR